LYPSYLLPHGGLAQADCLFNPCAAISPPSKSWYDREFD
jgi:hypothetical protein